MNALFGTGGLPPDGRNLFSVFFSTAGTDPGLRDRVASRLTAAVSYSTEDDDDDDSNTDVEEVVVVIVVVVVVTTVVPVIPIDVSEWLLGKRAKFSGLAPVFLAVESLQLVTGSGLLATLVRPLLVLVVLLLLLITTAMLMLLFLSLVGMLFTLVMSNVVGEDAFRVALFAMLVGDFATESTIVRELIRDSRLLGL